MGEKALERVGVAMQSAEAKPERKAGGLAGVLASLSDNRKVLRDSYEKIRSLRATADLNFRDPNGSIDRISRNNKKVPIAMATWCPHSAALASLLENSTIRKLNSDWVFIFVFVNEWPTVKSFLGDEVKAGKITAADASQRIDQLQQRANGLQVFDLNFLTALPGKVEFLEEGSDQPSPETFPTVFVANDRKYALDAEAFVRNELHLPSWIVDQLHW
jgi:hypothetical protein